MSMHTLPILFVNLGGEMLYVLTQRLSAQHVAKEKADKVVCDIVNSMYGVKFLGEIIRPQELFARKNLRIIFEKLVHTSIMRLNTVSMDKLYDLMTMAVKHQITFCAKPKDVLLVTYNHLDSIAKLIPDSQIQTKALVENMYKTIDRMFGSMTSGEFQRVRCTLLTFFQDVHVRVSVFLRDKVQTQTGRFIQSKLVSIPPQGIEQPGGIKMFKKDGSWSRSRQFPKDIQTVKIYKEPSYGIYGDRVIILGRNMYEDEKGTEGGVSVDNSPQIKQDGSGVDRLGVKRPPLKTVMSSELDQMGVDESAAKELDMLNALLGHMGGGEGGSGKQSGGFTFQLDLFGKDSSSSGGTALPSASDLSAASSSVASHSAQRLQVNKVRSSKLDSIAAEMTLEDNKNKGQSKGDDLLDLLDRT